MAAAAQKAAARAAEARAAEGAQKAEAEARAAEARAAEAAEKVEAAPKAEATAAAAHTARINAVGAAGLRAEDVVEASVLRIGDEVLALFYGVWYDASVLEDSFPHAMLLWLDEPPTKSLVHFRDIRKYTSTSPKQ
jgi:sRNA-binding protein